MVEMIRYWSRSWCRKLRVSVLLLDSVVWSMWHILTYKPIQHHSEGNDDNSGFYLSNICYVPDAMLKTLRWLSHLILKIILSNWCYFTYEQIKLKGLSSFSKFHSVRVRIWTQFYWTPSLISYITKREMNIIP